MSGVNVAPQQAAALAEIISENVGKGFVIGQAADRDLARDVNVSFGTTGQPYYKIGGRGKVTQL